MVAKDYDSFAPFYDLAMGEHSEVAEQIHAIIQKYLPHAKSLFELGCGSGNLLKILTRYYQCQGIDLSRKMIAEAKRKVPGVPLSVADMTTVKSVDRFDVVLCAFDTINHLHRFRDWCRVFDRAYALLNPGGLFIFDINTKGKIDRYHRDPPYAEIESQFISIFDVQKKRGPHYTVTVRVLNRMKSNSYRLHEMVVQGATFPIERIRDTLKRSFARVSMIDLERQRVSEASDEVYFICRKGL